MTVTYNVSIYSECREEEENWKDLASVLQAGDKREALTFSFSCTNELQESFQSCTVCVYVL